MSNTNTTVQKIITALDELQEIRGTEHLLRNVVCIRNKGWVLAKVNALEAAGECVIIRSNGGRGKKTIYRRNRNSPGLPRRTTKRQVPNE